MKGFAMRQRMNAMGTGGKLDETIIGRHRKGWQKTRSGEKEKRRAVLVGMARCAVPASESEQSAGW
jgi:hypothetical protein